MPDKDKILHATVTLINDRLHFNGLAGNNQPISIDYIPPLGDDLGYTSLELLLLSLSSCVGTAVLTLLRKMKKEISGFEIKSVGKRKLEHPTGFSQITLDISLSSSNTSPEELNTVIDLTEQKYCPVWSMLKGNTDLCINYKILL
jgi:putative redox protein